MVEASGDLLPLFYGLDAIDTEISPVFTELTAGTYDIYVVDRVGCSDIATVAVGDSPLVELSLVSQQAAECQEENGFISVAASGGTGVLQVRLNGAIVPKPEDISGLAAGNYQLQVVDELGCVDALSVQLDAANCPVYLPNVFSPNRDGINDFFFPQASGDAQIEIVRFQIFDRWGGVVFEQANGSLGDVKFRWDGRKGGDLMPQGVYVYFLELRYPQGETLQLNGDITLLQ